MALISETFLLSNSNTDVLKAPSRLAAVPFNGEMIFEVSANLAVAANNWKLTIALPDGEIPVDAQLVPANAYDTANAVLHNSSELQYSFPAILGGHFLISLEKTGTALAILRTTLVG